MKINIDIIKNIGKEKLIIIAIAAVILILCTVWENSEKTEENRGVKQDEAYVGNLNADEFMEEYVKSQEKKLKAVLEKIDGAGEIYVMITIKNSSEDKILMEQSISGEKTDEDDGTGGKRNICTYSEDNSTVYITDENGNTVPYVLSRMSPEIEGVAVIAQGGNNAVVKEKIISVIKALFDIEINKISVTK